MGKPTGRNGREHMSQRGQQTSFNGATGMSDIEGKAARVAASEHGQRASFKSLLILIRSGDMCRKRAFWPYTNRRSSARQSWPNSYFLINTFYFGLSSDRGFFGYKKRITWQIEGRATGRGVRLWSQRPHRRHPSENQQPQTKVRRRLMRMLEMMSILFLSQ